MVDYEVYCFVSSMRILQKKDGVYTNEESKPYEKDAAIFGNLWIDLHQEKTWQIISIWLSLIIYWSTWRNGEIDIDVPSMVWSHSNFSLNHFASFVQTKEGKNTSKSCLIPIARIFQCCLLWLSGLADKFLNVGNISSALLKMRANTMRKIWKMF